MSLRVSKKIQSLGLTSFAIFVLMASVQSAEARRGKGVSMGSSSKSSTTTPLTKPDTAKTNPNGTKPNGTSANGTSAASTNASRGSSSSNTFIFVSVPKKETAKDEPNSGPPPAFRNLPAPILQASAAGAPDEKRLREAQIGIDLPALGANAVLKAGQTPGFLLMN
jgi:hypothetical protein